MAKVTFTKLGLNKNTKVDTFEYNGQQIEVKDYLPIEDKLILIQKIINAAVEDNGYYNPAKVYVNMIVEMILAYTNITVTDKQHEDIAKLYDAFVSSGFSGELLSNHINPGEFKQIQIWTSEVIHNIYEYKNSAAGIMDVLSNDYSNLNLDAENIQKNISDPQNLNLLKDILTKLN